MVRRERRRRRASSATGQLGDGQPAALALGGAGAALLRGRDGQGEVDRLGGAQVQPFAGLKGDGDLLDDGGGGHAEQPQVVRGAAAGEPLAVPKGEAPGDRHLLVAEEAEEARLVFQHPQGGAFLSSQIRQAGQAGFKDRSVVVLSQGLADFLQTPHGHTVLENVGTTVLLRQPSSGIDVVAQKCGLTAAEQHFLLTCGQGSEMREALVLARGAKVEIEIGPRQVMDTAGYTARWSVPSKS